MSDPRSSDAQQQEQMRQYVEQLRAADPAEIVAQAFTMLATGAEVKLGRPDARVLIDSLSGLAGAAESRVPEQLARGMQDAVAQLQQAQVAAERQAEAAQESASAETGVPDEGQGGEAGGAAGAATGQDPSDALGRDDDQRMTDRLWIPGRDR